MKIEGYKEITEVEYDKFSNEEGARFYNYKTNEAHFFKEVNKFPIVFEDEFRRIEVYEKRITIQNTIDKEKIIFDYSVSYPLLLEAMKKAEEIKE